MSTYPPAPSRRLSTALPGRGEDAVRYVEVEAALLRIGRGEAGVYEANLLRNVIRGLEELVRRYEEMEVLEPGGGVEAAKVQQTGEV